ncbi:BatD family protein [Phaeodactylibacter xiamenensis]|uniref:BatD family protein n=1 Tax=Phaeodactylibacter xiamenensis TaxID=1524460 RepID=UPI0024A7FA47|nr:BatD family protein [Phaeodactylibacter xiamenensis]
MAMIRMYVTACLAILLSTGALSAQTTFEATTDARRVLENSYFEVTFTLSNAQGGQFSPPSFENFLVVSGPSQAVSTSMINGQVSRTQAYSYTLKPRRTGTFTIGSASIKVNRTTLQTKPLTIEVVKGRKGEPGAAEQVFIRAEPSTETAYVGQQILLDYKLYTTLDVESFNILEESGYQGFFAQDVRRFNGRVMREVINGVQYTTKVLKRIALFPQQTGQLSIEPMNVQLGVVKEGAKRSRSFFFTPEVRPYPAATETVNIEVLPLPAGAPESFTGAVGDYQIRPDLSSKTATTDDALTLILTVRGSGDIKRVEAPALDLPEGFEVYEPKAVEETNLELNASIEGKKVFEYLLLPKVPGDYEFTPKFTYFSPDSAKYVTLADQSFSLYVKQGTGQPGRATASLNETEDIGPLMLSPVLTQTRTPFLGSALFWGLLAAPLLLFGGLLGWRRHRARQDDIDPNERRMQAARGVAQERLSLAKSHLKAGDSRAFYDEVSKAILGYVGDKLQIPRSSMSKSSLRQRLQELDLDESLIETVMSIVQDCEMALFAGQADAGKMETVYERATQAIAGVEKAV